MHRCDDYEYWLSEVIAGRTTSEDTLGEYQRLMAEHLSECPACRALAHELHVVESALYQQPRIRPAAALHARIMQRVKASAPMEIEHWELMPRDIWVPAAIFVVILAIALLASPSYLHSGQPFGELEPSIGYWPDVLIQLGNTVLTKVQNQGFWIAWTGLFAILTALGMRLTIRNWSDDHAQSLQYLEHLVTDKAVRLWNSARRAH
jgi:hypothetical protein